MSLLINIQNATKSFGPQPLFSDLTLDMRAEQRIGVIGPNGSGKSTLLKVLAGIEELDEGVRSERRFSRIGYLAQDEVFPQGVSILDVMLDALEREPVEDHERQTQVAKCLTQVGFSDHAQTADVLSGGWKKRLAIARELVREPDFLLLDEPTNHLDLPSIVWLERLLRAAPFGYLVASHDRAFLRAVVNEVIEISRRFPGGYYRADGTYDEFTQRREEFLAGQLKQQSSVANQVRRETEWLGRQAKARTSKAGYRIDEAVRKSEELTELRQRNAQTKSAGIDFVATGRMSTKLLNAQKISKTLSGRGLFSNLDLLLTRGSKIGLLGPNGSGKTTLLRVLADEMATDSGTITRADKLRVVIFEQGRAMLDPAKKLRHALCPDGDNVQFRNRPIHVVAWAKQFLFQEEQLELPVGDLSGGEQARVRIAQLMLQPADLLLLDEPTNDLDIPALEVLEDSLNEFPGALIMISHDRELMDRLCSEVIGLDGDGKAAIYGGVAQWLTAFERSQISVQSRAKESRTKRTPQVTRNSTDKPRTLSYQEKQELAGIEQSILNAEERLAESQKAVENAASADHEVLAAACTDLEAAQKVVDHLYSRWQELDAIATN